MKKKGKLLTQAQFKQKALNGEEVYVIYEEHNPYDKHHNVKGVFKPELFDDKSGCYVAGLDWTFVDELENELCWDDCFGEAMLEIYDAVEAKPKPKKPKNDYAYQTIEEYEEIVGCKVNEAFRIGWNMARTTNEQLMGLKK